MKLSIENIYTDASLLLNESLTRVHDEKEPSSLQRQRLHVSYSSAFVTNNHTIRMLHEY